MRKTSLASLMWAATLSILAQPVAAQVSDMDRLQRCENNREALAGAQNQLVMSGYASDEQIARYRAALLAARRELNAYNQLSAAGTTVGDSLTLQARRSGPIRRLAEIGRSVTLGCMTASVADYSNCVLNIPSVLAGMIDTAVAARSGAGPLLRQVETYSNNLVALRCDQARAPDVADISGAWRGLDGTIYSIRQSGNQFSWTRSGTDERATGTISGSSMSAQWAGSQGSGGGGGSIQFGANGVPVQIRWSNGNVFTR